MMQKVSLSFFLLLLKCGVTTSSNGRSLRSSDFEQKAQRSLVNMMVPGPRVAEMDRSTAICGAEYNYDSSIPMESTVIEYYYGIESTENITTSSVKGSMLIHDLEETLFMAINPSILWCYYDESDIGKRNLKALGDHAHQRMTLEEARRLSIVTFATTPDDEETTSASNAILFAIATTKSCLLFTQSCPLFSH
jgi:hypothetical protein